MNAHTHTQHASAVAATLKVTAAATRDKASAIAFTARVCAAAAVHTDAVVGQVVGVISPGCAHSPSIAVARVEAVVILPSSVIRRIRIWRRKGSKYLSD